MTSFTPIAEGDIPCITLDPSNIISTIDDNIYGGFTEHMGRCIYGGLYEPGSPLADKNGFRTDVVDLIKELRVPVVRYPGGNFTAAYHWQDGIGPKQTRPKRPELAWLGVESNQFGTDEFMKWCKVVDTEPFLCLNMGTGTLDEALAWLEYCNGTRDTHYANLRRKNGHEEPYNVKYWALGNECWGPWQVEQTDAKTYAAKAWQWAKALKLMDSTIKLVLCGETGFTSWDFTVMSECLKWSAYSLSGNRESSLIDMVSIHIYTSLEQHVPNVLAPKAAERAILNTAALINLCRVENKVPSSVPVQTICFDEWNVWDPQRARGDLGAEEKYTLSDALAVSVFLNVFIRQSAYIGMCNLAQSVNVISPILTTPTSIIKQTTYYPLVLFSRYMRGQALAVHVRSPQFTGSMASGRMADGTDIGWLQGSLSLLDVSAAVNVDEKGEKWVSLAVVNASETEDFETQLDVKLPPSTSATKEDGVVLTNGDHHSSAVNGTRTPSKKSGEVQVFTVTGKNRKVTNTDGKEEVGIHESTWHWDGETTPTYNFPRASLTLLRWRISTG